MAELNAGAHRRLIIPAVLLSTLVALTSLTVVLLPRPAGADQIADLQAQAAAISQKLVEEQLQIDAYQQQYSVASAKVASDARTIAQIGQQISQDEQQIAARTTAVRHQAINSYMDAGTQASSADAALFSGGGEAAQAASEYSSIAVGNITTAMDQLRTAQRTLLAQQATLQRQQAQDQTDQTQQASSLGHATGSQQQLQSVQAQVTGQLATAVAQQAAAQSAAAATAVAAARRAAAKSSTTRSPSAPTTRAPSAPTSTSPSVSPAQSSTTSTAPAPSAGGGSGGSSGGASTDPALNPFLQCVVQAESGGNYAAVSPGGTYMGAFQFGQSTWNLAAQAAGIPGLVGVPPNTASKADQDTVAVALYALDGQQPWLGDRCAG
jgi:peptidoglycan hydrolase CwlO-like protein